MSRFGHPGEHAEALLWLLRIQAQSRRMGWNFLSVKARRRDFYWTGAERRG